MTQGELIAQAAAMFQSRATVMRELADEYGGKWAIVLDGYVHSGDAPTVLPAGLRRVLRRNRRDLPIRY